MNGTINKFKWFWAWQDDREEAWLGEMSRQGLHLQSTGPFGSYTFERGEKKEYTYRLDFVTQARKDESYFQLFRDAGWKHVGEMGGWQYWRKESQSGVEPEIFTDAASKVQKYRRLLGFLMIFLPILLFGILNFGDYTERYQHWVFAGIFSLYFVLLVIYSAAVVMIARRIIRLRKQ